MENSEQDTHLLLENFRASLQVLLHEDNRKAHLLTVFLIVQGVLFGFYNWAVANDGVISVGIAIFAFALGILWFFVMERIKAFVEFRHWYTIQLENEIGLISAITAEYILKEEGKIVIGDNSYSLRRHQKLLSISRMVESSVPLLISVFWAFLLIREFWWL